MGNLGFEKWQTLNFKVANFGSKVANFWQTFGKLLRDFGAILPYFLLKIGLHIGFAREAKIGGGIGKVANFGKMGPKIGGGRGGYKAV
ncbi:hypothetical protein EVA_11149 [gut metagenome]|uniref:Uncharacterized protein n=1 Tax=gut metagenome TaxID=749906 RepID=J9GLT8_9ZZZZ